MKCQYCGHEMQQGEKFCGNCGRPAAPQGGAPENGKPFEAGPEKVPKKKKRLPIILGCLAVVLVAGALVIMFLTNQAEQQVREQEQIEEEERQREQEEYEAERMEAEEEFQAQFQFPTSEDSRQIKQLLRGTWRALNGYTITFGAEDEYECTTQYGIDHTGEYAIDAENEILYLIFDSRDRITPGADLDEYTKESTAELYWGYDSRGVFALDYNGVLLYKEN